jgi:hypothetical protein
MYFLCKNRLQIKEYFAKRYTEPVKFLFMHRPGSRLKFPRSILLLRVFSKEKLYSEVSYRGDALITVWELFFQRLINV